MVLPGESPRTSISSHTLCLLVELPHKFESLSQDKFNHSIGACSKDKLSIAAWWAGWNHPKLTTRRLQSEADAEMAAVLFRAAKSIELEWTPPPCPEHSS